MKYHHRERFGHVLKLGVPNKMDVSYKTHAPLGLSENRVPKSTELYYFSNIAIQGCVPNFRHASKYKYYTYNIVIVSAMENTLS